MLQFIGYLFLGVVVGAAIIPVAIAAFILSCVILASLFAGIILIVFQVLIWIEMCYFGIKGWFNKL